MTPKSGRLAALKLVLGLDTFVDIFVHLAQDFTGTADADMVLADFTECDFDGYSQINNPAWDAPAIDGAGRAESKSALLTWTAGAGIAAPQTIKAVYVSVHMAGGTVLMWFKKLDPTVTLAVEGEQFSRKIDMLADNLVV